ncbi:MAG TPA: NUDIX pyrophosphatase [Bacteroidota bacterium]|nr:NUDIX pyrophosphatase [Bacteroidota bacterium]
MSSIVIKFVEVCVFKFENDRPWYLLLRRAASEKVYPNIWQFVSGSLDENERAQDAALRELHEETGLAPKGFWVVPYVNSFYDPADDCINLNPMFAAQVEPGSVLKLSHEHDEYQWCGFDDAVRRLLWHGQREGLRIVHEFIVRGEDAMRFARMK